MPVDIVVHHLRAFDFRYNSCAGFSSENFPGKNDYQLIAKNNISVLIHDTNAITITIIANTKV